MSVLAVFVADAHLDTEPWTGRPILGDSFHAFEFVVNTAIERGARFLFCAGDMIDARRPSSAVARFLRTQMERCQRDGVGVLVVEGQHDLAQPPWFTAVHPHPQHLHDRRVEAGPFRVYGLNWTPADKLAAALQGVPECDILVAHQVWEEFMGTITSPEGSLTQVPHASVVVTGDYHKYAVKRLHGADGQSLKVYSPGATHMRAIDEPEEHYLLLLYEDGRMTRMPIPGRVRLGLDTRDEGQPAENLVQRWQSNWRKRAEYLPEQLQKPLLRIRCFDTQQAELRRLTEELIGDQAHLFWDVQTEVTAERAEKVQAGRALREKGPAGCLPLVVPKNDARYGPLLRLIQSPDPKAELQTMRQERGL